MYIRWIFSVVRQPMISFSFIATSPTTIGSVISMTINTWILATCRNTCRRSILISRIISAVIPGRILWNARRNLIHVHSGLRPWELVFAFRNVLFISFNRTRAAWNSLSMVVYERIIMMISIWAFFSVDSWIFLWRKVFDSILIWRKASTRISETFFGHSPSRSPLVSVHPIDILRFFRESTNRNPTLIAWKHCIVYSIRRSSNVKRNCCNTSSIQLFRSRRRSKVFFSVYFLPAAGGALATTGGATTGATFGTGGGGAGFAL